MLLGFLLPLALSLPLPQEATAPQTIEPRIYLDIDEPLLVEIEVSVDMAPIEAKMDIAFVDQHTELGDGVEVGFRHYVRANLEVLGIVTDAPLAGQRVLIEARGEDVIASSTEGHWLPDSQLQDALDRDYPSLGLFARFPDSLAVGDSFELNLKNLGNLIVDLGATQEAMARMTLDAYDVANQIATYSGNVTIVQQENGLTFTSEVELDMVTDLGAKHIQTLKAKGKTSTSGQPKGETEAIPLNGTFDFSLTAERGKMARKALLRKPKFRKRFFSYAPLGFSLEGPAYWCDDKNQDGFELRPVTEPYNEAIIQIARRTESSRDPETFLDATEKELEDRPGFKSEKVSCKLGKGRAFLFDIESEDGERLRLRAELYPYKGTWLQCRYIGRPKSFKKYEKDYKKIIKSLRLTQ